MFLEIEEEWRPVVGYEGLYEVSSHGRVRSLGRMAGGRNGSLRPVPGRIMSPYRTSMGYLAVQLSLPGPGRSSKHRNIHVLVAEAFIGPRPEGCYCCHNDGTRRNNRPENLRWDTPSENAKDMDRHGTRGKSRRKVRTHCKYGHAMTPENTQTRSDASGVRCKACMNAKSRDYHHRVRKHRGKRRISEVAPES